MELQGDNRLPTQCRFDVHRSFPVILNFIQEVEIVRETISFFKGS